MFTLIFAAMTGLGIFMLFHGLEKQKHFFLWTGLLTFGSFVHKRWSRWILPVLAFLSGAGWGLINWEKFLKFLHSLQGRLTDPIYGKNTGFYLFELPLFDALYQLGPLLSGIGLSWLIIMVPSLRRGLERLAEKTGLKNFPAPVPALGAMAAILLVPGIVTLTVLPPIFQRFRVEPNEITLEKPNVGIDRYIIDDEYRQVMVSARELNLDNLPEKSQTFINKRFKYTHGFGIILTNVNEFTPEGLPNLEIKDIPPVSSSGALEVGQPRIYYGEATDSYTIVNSNEAELDYPSGETNIDNRYDGSGGVQLESIWRKLVYGWKFAGIRLLLSGYPNKESRIMFHRNVFNRVRTLAPFLEFDNDPYIVLANKKLYWIIDAYTTSDRFPYSEHFTPDVFRTRDRDRLPIQDSALTSLYGINYIRNSVKCVVDAYEGSVDFYGFDRDDLLIKVWQKIFPEMLKPETDMPGFLLEHIRYPADMLLTQGLMYSKFHMRDPAVFYNQEDLWIRATEKYYNRVVPVEPYYILWTPPGSEEVEFSLILPFTPKKRQVMIGWIAGLCDPDSYGRMTAYQFPKEKRVLRPQQVETKIDQDSYLSGQLTLWSHRASNVIRGNVLAIPVEETIIHVEPICLQAETAAYPELRLVAVMHDDNLSYATTFDKALQVV
ncbi:MAG: UPF0182 family protein [Desulfotignum sp.]